MANSFDIKFDFSKLIAKLDKITDTALDVVREAAQVGAEHLYFEARIRCPVSDDAHFFYGTQAKKDGTRYFFKPGSLRDSIYHVYSKDHSGKGHATYHIAWNHKKVPYGFMVEYGTSRAAAHPFLRPAFDAVADEALRMSYNVMLSRMKEIIG